MIVAAICTAGMRQRYPVIVHTAAQDTSCTISMCTVSMVLLYDIDVRVMSVRPFIFIRVDEEKIKYKKIKMHKMNKIIYILSK